MREEIISMMLEATNIETFRCGVRFEAADSVIEIHSQELWNTTVTTKFKQNTKWISIEKSIERKKDLQSFYDCKIDEVRIIFGSDLFGKLKRNNEGE